MENNQPEKQFEKGDKWFLLSYKLGDRSHLTIRKVVRKDGDIEVWTEDGRLLAAESDLVEVVDLLISS